MNTETEEVKDEPESYFLNEIGLKYINFGQLLRDPDTSIKDLSKAAWECGLAIQIGIAPAKNEQ